MIGRVAAVGDNVVDRYVDRATMYPGGNAVNVGVHARRCGAYSAYVGAVGTDAAGGAVLSALRQEDVDTSLTRIVDGPNAYATVRVDEGNRVFESMDIGVSRFRLDAHDLENLKYFDVVHTGECSMIESQLPDLSAVATLMSFDFSERPWEYIERHAQYADIAIRSLPATEVSTAYAEAVRLAALGPRTVAVTLGSGGAGVLRGDRWVHAPATDVEVVDTLGAGDAFIGRLLTGLVRETPLEELVPLATAYASASCAAFGAFGYPTPDVEPEPSRASTDGRPTTASVAELRRANGAKRPDPNLHGGVDQG